jgi:hypothetical protein
MQKNILAGIALFEVNNMGGWGGEIDGDRSLEGIGVKVDICYT